MIRITVTLDSAAMHALAVLVERARRMRDDRKQPSVSQVIRSALCELVTTECIENGGRNAGNNPQPRP